MKKSAYKKQVRRIRQLADRWIRPLGLAWWTIDQHYYKSPSNFHKVTGASSRDTVARCVADWRYRTAQISFNVSVWRWLSDAEAEKSFVHELMHIFLAEIMDCGDDQKAHLERVCTTLADAFVWSRQGKSSIPDG